MKSQMSSFDIAATVREMQKCVGLRVEKAFLRGHHELLLRLGGAGRKFTVVITLGRGIWLHEGFITSPDSRPPAFAMLLRKHLGGRTLDDIRQHGFDRVVVMEFGDAWLVAELFGSGNVILVQAGKIIQPMTSRSWRARDVKPGYDYAFPPESADPFALDAGGIAAVLESSEKDLVRCLALELNLGGAHAEEVCRLLGVDKGMSPKELDSSQIERISGIIRDFGLGLDSMRPHIVLDGGEPLDLQPFPLGIHEGLERAYHESFGQAASEYFACLPETAESAAPGKSQRVQKLERQLENQVRAAEELEQKAEELRRLGDAVYAEYAMLDGLLTRVRSMLDGGSWQAARKDILGLDRVVDFNAADGKLKVELAGGEVVELDVRMGINENAARIYDMAKKSRQKAEGAREAADATRVMLEEARSRESMAADVKPRKPARRFWFEKFRWFISSEGNIVVAGRDARSNDMVVKKHLKDDDIYVHADFGGAPSVVVKDGRHAGGETLREACVFALAMSKAWKSGIASGSAYWVKPDQVSKTPQPGEFLARGAFVIRGRRNYSDKLDIRLAVGMVRYQDEDRVMCGPVEAVLAHAAGQMFVIEPGDEPRNSVSRRLADMLNVPVEELDRVLPPGDMTVRELAGPGK